MPSLVALDNVIENRPNRPLRPWSVDVLAHARDLAHALAQLRDRADVTGPLDTLSMGMSGDLELAIDEGATLVRVGTALFGARD